MGGPATAWRPRRWPPSGSRRVRHSPTPRTSISCADLSILRSSSIVPKASTTPSTCSQDRERSEEHTSELQSHLNLVCRLLLEKKKKNRNVRKKRLGESR